MKLYDYLKTHDLTEEKFAERAELSQAAINRYCKGQRIPNKAAMAAISNASGGAVQPNDFFAEHLPSDSQKRAHQ